jgi:hypothetical protein
MWLFQIFSKRVFECAGITFLVQRARRCYHRGMVYDVLIRRSNGVFTAIVLGLPNIVVKARSRTEAIRRAQAAANKLMAEGEVVRVEADPAIAPRPLSAFAGMWADDESFPEFMAAMAEYRRHLDAPSTMLREKPERQYRVRKPRRSSRAR